MPYPSQLLPEPLTLRQSTADLYLHKRCSNTVLSQSLWGPWVLVCTRFVWAFLASLVEMRFDSKCKFILLPSCWGFSFVLGCGVSLHSCSSTYHLTGFLWPWTWSISSLPLIADPGERSSDPTRDWPRLVCECPGVSSRAVGRWWPAAGLGALSVAAHPWDFDEVAIIFFTFTKIAGRELISSHQQKMGLKIYWAWPRPSEQDPVSPSVSLSHQEASLSLLSFSIRGQTDWKPQSQETNQSHHMDHSLV